MNLIKAGINTDVENITSLKNCETFWWIYAHLIFVSCITSGEDVKISAQYRENPDWMQNISILHKFLWIVNNHTLTFWVSVHTVYDFFIQYIRALQLMLFCCKINFVKFYVMDYFGLKFWAQNIAPLLTQYVTHIPW